MRRQQQPEAGHKRVAVLAGSSLTWREQVMRGIASYATESGPWQIYTAPEGVEDALFFTESYRWDGLIVRVSSERLARRILRLKVPAVSIGSIRMRGEALPRVRVDDESLVEGGLRHLLAAGLREFAYCGPLIHGVSEDRGAAFLRAVRAAGCKATSYMPARTVSEDSAWQTQQRGLMRWLKALPKPVGILTWNPDVACQLVEAANRAGVRVPAEVSVLSGDEDTVKCELSRPSISALEVPSARIGYEAASLLDRLMRGKRVEAEGLRVPPAGILHVRESTRIPDSIDRDMHAAKEFIRRRLAEPIGTADVARHLELSRRTLERHFGRVFGCSIREELQAARMEAARHLLLNTHLPIMRISRACGFRNCSYFIELFRAHSGRTPAVFREVFRPGVRGR